MSDGPRTSRPEFTNRASAAINDATANAHRMTNRGLRHATEAAARFFRNGHSAIPVLFGLFLTAMGPWWSVYLINFDEGINLMKGALVADGYRLYSEIRYGATSPRCSRTSWPPRSCSSSAAPPRPAASFLFSRPS